MCLISFIVTVWTTVWTTVWSTVWTTGYVVIVLFVSCFSAPSGGSNDSW